MTSNPPPSPEDPGLPPRHRVSLEKLRSEALESELWNLDDGTDPSETDPDPSPKPSTPTESHDWKSHLPTKKIRHTPSEGTAAEPQTQNETRPDPSKAAEPPKPEQPPDPHSLFDELGELDEIDDWDDTQVPAPVAQPAPEELPDANTTPSADDAPKPSATSDTDSVPATKHAKGNRRKESFSTNEIIAIAGVGIVLVMIAGFFLISSLGSLPRITDPYQKPALPVQGSHFSINAVNSFWRAPITTGADADTVQRGTELIPILEVTATGQDAALRVQFRNSDGESVGDPITHAVRGETTLVIPSTAGLEDVNIHNAYRTNLIDPWTAEILEASAGTTAGSAFRSLLTIPISPNRQ